MEVELSLLQENGIMELLPSRDLLTKLEYEVIMQYYVESIPISTIAKRTNKSRQAVNQAKNRAIKKIKDATIF